MSKSREQILNTFFNMIGHYIDEANRRPGSVEISNIENLYIDTIKELKKEDKAMVKHYRMQDLQERG